MGQAGLSEFPKSEHASESGLTRRELLVTGAGVVAGAAVGGLVGYGVSPKGQETVSSGTTKTPIRIGAAYPLTGGSAGDGLEMLHGLQLGVEMLNSQGGVVGRQLEIVSDDIESDLAPDKITMVVQRLVTQKKVSVVFMGYASLTNSEFRVPAQSGVPLIHSNAFSGNTEFVAKDLKQYGMVFEACPTEVNYGLGFADFMANLQATGGWVPKKKTAAILTSQDPYSVGIARVFRDAVQKAGWQVPLYETFAAPLSEWGPMLAKIRQIEPGIIFHADWIVGDLATFTKQFRAQPTPSLLYEQYGPAVPEYLDLTGNAADGVIWSTVIGVLPDALGDEFVKRFAGKFGAKPGWSAAGAQYDAVMLWANAVGGPGDPSDYPKVVARLRTEVFRGVCGSYHFNSRDQACLAYPEQTRDPSLGMPHLTFQIQNQQQIVISPDPYTQGAFKLPAWL